MVNAYNERIWNFWRDNTSNDKTALPTGKKRALILLVICASSFMNSFMTNSINLAIPAMSAEFTMTATSSSWVVSTFLLTMAALCVPFGRISDLTSHRVIYLVGLAAFAITSLLTIFSWSEASLLTFRVLSGCSAALIFSSNTPILLAAYPREQTGRAMGYMVTGVYLGLATGPVLGGVMTGTLGWPSIFILAAIADALCFVFGVAIVPRNNGEINKQTAGTNDTRADMATGASRFDPAGSVLFVAVIVCLVVGFSTFTQSWVGKALVVVSIVLFAIFVFVELHAKSPAINIRFFLHNKNYTCSNFAALLNYGATYALTYLMSTYLQVVQGFSASIAGIILISQPICMAAVSPVMGRLSDKHSPYILATIGMSICAVSILLFCFIGVSTPLPVVIIGLVLMGVGVGTFSSPNNNAIMSTVNPKDNGVASSLLNTMRAVGQSFSLAIITLISSINLGSESFSSASPTQMVGATRICFIVFIVISACAILLSVQRKSASTPGGGKPAGRSVDSGSSPE
jgi:MFS family permease